MKRKSTKCRASEYVRAREAVVEWINGPALRGPVTGPAFVIGVDELAKFVDRYAQRYAVASGEEV